MSETLTDNEMASLEKVAQLRCYAGQLRAAVRRAHRLLLAHEHITPLPTYPLDALKTLSAALAIPFPPEQP